MLELYFELNGRRVDSRNIGGAIEKATLQIVKEHITKKVGDARCPDHRSGAKIVAKGRDLSNLTFDVSGCCDKLIEEVKRKLSD